MSGLEQIKENRDQILSIALSHGADKLRLFGSVVRGEEQSDSDVDFLVTMLPGYDLLDLVALERELEGVLHRKADMVSDEEVSPYLRDRIFQEAVAI